MTIPLPSTCESISQIESALDASTHEVRVAWIAGLKKREQSALYDLAGSADPMPLDALCGEEGEVVIHEGKNTLPLFTRFQKRFAMRSGVVQGYNHNPDWMMAFTGPGHFTCQMGEAGVFIDYTQMPTDVPEEFPALVDNDGGMRKLVFGGLEDRVRRVSRHCTIGEARKGGKSMGQWFVLMRVDQPPPV